MEGLFKRAKRIFVSPGHGENNVFSGYFGSFTAQAQDGYRLLLTGRSFYKLYVNGRFVTYGPSRAAHERCRVDVIDLSAFLKPGANTVAVELIAYTNKTLSSTGEESFLQLEVVCGEESVLWTDENSSVCRLPYKKQDAPRFSHARNNMEIYSLTPGYDAWRTEGFSAPEPVGLLEEDILLQPVIPDQYDFSIREGARRTYIDPDGKYVNYDFGAMDCGLIGMEFTALEKCELELIYPDKLTHDKGEFDMTFSHVKPVTVCAEPGHYIIEAFEPSNIQYVQLRGDLSRVRVDKLFLRRTQIKDLQGGFFSCSDAQLNRIYESCRRSLIINTFDIFMDCPSRERGGWTADAFWTSQAARMFLGNTSVERRHLENLLSPTIRRYYDQLPACYPAGNTIIIHNWTIMFLLELYSYYRFTGDMDFMKAHEADVEWVVSTLSRYENRFGLLENLDEYIYVDGTTSTAGPKDPSIKNQQYNLPISSATNAMYALALKQLGGVYGNDVWQETAEKIDAVLRKVCDKPIPEGSNEFISDAFSMDENGEPHPNGYSSEASQYFLLWRDLVKQEGMDYYLNSLFDMFGTNPSVPFSNITRFFYNADFHMGTNARMEVLAKYGKVEKLVSEIRRFAQYMMDNGSGLIWEGWGWYASVAHGFGSWYGWILEREISGLHMPDAVEKTVRVAPHLLDLKWARSYAETDDGLFSVSWSKSDTEFTLDVSAPEGYRIDLKLPREIRGWDIAYRVSTGSRIRLTASVED